MLLRAEGGLAAAGVVMEVKAGRLLMAEQDLVDVVAGGHLTLAGVMVVGEAGGH